MSQASLQNDAAGAGSRRPSIPSDDGGVQGGSVIEDGGQAAEGQVSDPLASVAEGEVAAEGGGHQSRRQVYPVNGLGWAVTCYDTEQRLGAAYPILGFNPHEAIQQLLAHPGDPLVQEAGAWALVIATAPASAHPPYPPFQAVLPAGALATQLSSQTLEGIPAAAEGAGATSEGAAATGPTDPLPPPLSPPVASAAGVHEGSAAGNAQDAGAVGAAAENPGEAAQGADAAAADPDALDAAAQQPPEPPTPPSRLTPEAARKAAVDSGGVEAVTEAIRAHGQSPPALAAACRALQNLCFRCADARGLAGHAGAVEALVACARAHSAGESRALLLAVLVALQSVLTGSPENRARAEAAGGTEACVECVQRCMDNHRVVSAAIRILWSLTCTSPPSSAAAAAAPARTISPEELASVSAAISGALPAKQEHPQAPPPPPPAPMPARVSAESVLSAVAAALAEHHEREAVAEAACAFFANVAYASPAGKAAAAAGERVSLLVHALLEHPDSEGVQQAGLRALWNALANRTADGGATPAHHAASDAGAVEAAITACGHWPGVAAVVEPALQALWMLVSTVEGAPQKAVRLGALQPVTEAMRASRSSLVAQCAGLWSMCLMLHRCTRDELVSEAEWVLFARKAAGEAMAAHPESATVQRTGSIVISACWPMDENEAPNVGQAAVPAAIAAVKRFVRDQPVFEAAMWALSSLCVASSCRELAAMHSGVEAISASLKEYRPLGSSDAERQSSAKAQTAALSALEALCRDCIGNQNTAAECSCLEAAVAALHDLEDSTEVVEAGCKAICSIVHKRPELQMRACTAGAMAALVRVLDRYFHDPDIVEIATHCIHAVADKSADCQMQATVDNAIPVFVKAMKKQQGSVEVLECCLRAVSCIAWTHVRAKVQAAVGGALECAVAAVNAFPESLGVCRAACGLLSVVTSDRGQEQVQARARRAGAAQMCRKAQAHHSHDSKISLHASLGLARLGE